MSNIISCQQLPVSSLIKVLEGHSLSESGKNRSFYAIVRMITLLILFVIMY